jgi:SAM-dependent methyltransferase
VKETRHDDVQQAAWDQSYARLENHLFWPTEEIVRFLSRHVRRRVAADEYVDVLDALARSRRLLDLGCGLGRHVALAHEIGLSGYGIDVSETAIAKGREWLGTIAPELPDRLVAGDVRELPWPDRFFSVVVSHGVLDSMPFDIARAAVEECHRTLVEGGVMYADVIAFDGRTTEPGEILVDTGFEAGTVQSYFDERRLDSLVADRFSIIRRVLVTHADRDAGTRSGRWHVELRADDV